jgi:hypothetical protein
LGLSETDEAKLRLFDWRLGENVSWIFGVADPLEMMSGTVERDELWTGFMALVRGGLGMAQSEAEVERIIYPSQGTHSVPSE